MRRCNAFQAARSLGLSESVQIALMPPMRGGSPIANPLVQGGAAAGGGGGGGYAPPPESPADMAPTAPSHRASGFSLGNLGGGLTHPDNTSAHVGTAVALAFIIVLVIKYAGFRFSVDAGVAGG